jgi:hypothetical protein
MACAATGGPKRSPRECSPVRQEGWLRVGWGYDWRPAAGDQKSSRAVHLGAVPPAVELPRAYRTGPNAAAPRLGGRRARRQRPRPVKASALRPSRSGTESWLRVPAAVSGSLRMRNCHPAIVEPGRVASCSGSTSGRPGTKRCASRTVGASRLGMSPKECGRQLLLLGGSGSLGDRASREGVLPRPAVVLSNLSPRRTSDAQRDLFDGRLA